MLVYLQDMASIETKLQELLETFPTGFIDVISKTHPEAEIYLVGGCVRDAILSRVTNDLDFVIRGVPLEKLQKTLANVGVVNLVGKTFGVLKFTPHDAQEHLYFDIALPRTEHAGLSGAYKDVNTQSDHTLPLEDDLSRRDFTINAIAYDIQNKKIIDPYNGANDCHNKIIRAVGNPEIRFQEDYLRMLRGLRFSVQLGFTFEETTKSVIAEKISCINDAHNGERLVPYETIAREFLKSLYAHPVETLDTWDSFHVFQHILPELLEMKACPQPPEFHSEGDVWTHTRLALANLYSPSYQAFVHEHFPSYAKEMATISSDTVLAVLLHDVGKPACLLTPEKDGVDRIRHHNHEHVGTDIARAIMDRMKLSAAADVGVNMDRVAWLIKNHLLAPQAELMKATTIEKYFFKDEQLGVDLLSVIFADGSATIKADGTPALDSLITLTNKIKDLLQVFRQKQLAAKLPKALVDGKEIMEFFKIPPSKKIGELLEIAREAQLQNLITNKEEAFTLLAQHLV